MKAKLATLGTSSVLLTFALLLSGCTTIDNIDSTLDASSETSKPLPLPNVPQSDNIKDKPEFGWTELEEFYAQELNWGECGGGDFLCTPVYAPLDWDNPEAGLVYLAVFKKEATGDAIGSLLVNPGGPGASGIDLVFYASDYITTAAVREQYDIIGWDPRGVGFSDSVYCGEGELIDLALLAPGPAKDLASPESLAKAREVSSRLSEACYQGTGDLLGYIDTKSSARDMDLIRHLVGDDKLNYLGFSYGTQLGATYAALYPENVGRLVLDAAVVPTDTSEAGVIGQAGGFELAFNNYIAECVKTNSCPGGGTQEEVLERVKKLLLDLEQKPMDTTLDMELSVWTGLTGIIANLYSKGNWGTMTSALDAAFNGDGTLLMSSAYRYLDRNPDGTYLTNSMMSNIAINCMDGRYEQNAETVKATNDAIYAAAPLFGRYFANPQVACHGWKFPAKPSADLNYSATLNFPVLVIGTTGDPATPYQSAVRLANLLEKAVLITYEGEGHTVYANNSACVDSVVDEYLLFGKVPSANVVCKN
jgi:pimeloyl-ACP methyl ester carboxylesterase